MPEGVACNCAWLAAWMPRILETGTKSRRDLQVSQPLLQKITFQFPTGRT